MHRPERDPAVSSTAAPTEDSSPSRLRTSRSDTSSPAGGSPRSRTDAQTERGNRLPLVVWVLGAVAFVTGSSELIVAGVLPDVADSFHLSVARAGLLVTVFAIGMMVGAPVMAVATLYLPRRAALIAALVVFCVGHIIGALSHSFALALLGRFVAALATGTFWAVGSVVATAAAGLASSSRAMSVMIGGFTVASIVGVPAGTALGQAAGWRTPFWALAILAAAAAVALTRLLPKEVAGESPSAARELSVLRLPRLWLVYSATALSMAAVICVYTYVSPLLTGRAGVSPSVVPLAMLGYGVGALVGTAFGGRRGDRYPWTTAIPTLLTSAMLLAALALWGTTAAAAVALVAGLGFTGLAVNPILAGQVVAIAGPGRALSMALSTSSFNVGIAVGSWLGGVTISSGLGLRGPSLLGVAIAVVGTVPMLALARGVPRRPSTASERAGGERAGEQ